MNSPRQAVSAADALEQIPDQECRTILQYLIAHENTAVSVEELATVIDDDGDPPARHRRDVPERHAIAVHHNHLPRLDEMGIIHYNPRCQTAIYQQRAQEPGVVDPS